LEASHLHQVGHHLEDHCMGVHLLEDHCKTVHLLVDHCKVVHLLEDHCKVVHLLEDQKEVQRTVLPAAELPVYHLYLVKLV
jgi:hypothetical protein